MPNAYLFKDQSKLILKKTFLTISFLVRVLRVCDHQNQLFIQFIKMRTSQSH